MHRMRAGGGRSGRRRSREGQAIPPTPVRQRDELVLNREYAPGIVLVLRRDLNPTHNTFLLVDDVCGRRLGRARGDGDVRRLGRYPVLRIRPLRVEVLGQRQERRQRGEGRLSIAIRACASRRKLGASGEKTRSGTHEAPDSEVSAKTCTVPLSLQTHTWRSSGRKATPYITALSAPRRNSRMSFPVLVSHIRIRVPREDVVASSRPEGGTESVFSADVCAAMIDTGCFVGAGGGRDGGVEAGGPMGCGGGQGGRCTSCMCPICLPGMARSVECAAVASASRPWARHLMSIAQSKTPWHIMRDRNTHLVYCRTYPTPRIAPQSLRLETRRRACAARPQAIPSDMPGP